MCVAVTLIHPCLIFVGKVGTYPRVESSNQLHFRPSVIFAGKAGTYTRVFKLHFRPSLIFAGKARSQLLDWSLVSGSTLEHHTVKLFTAIIYYSL